MTKEEAKKMGATHIDNSGDYWKIVSDKESYFYDTLLNNWLRYAFDHNEDIKSGCIKPLT